MTRFAAWIMGSPLNAVLATFLLGFSGVFSWAAAVPSGLVILRLGTSRAVAPLSALVAVVALHVSQGELTLLGTSVATVLAASVLGAKASMPWSLLTASGASLAYATGLASLASEPLAALLAQYRQAMELLVQSGEPAFGFGPEVMVQLIGIWVGISASGNLFLARSMQARLFNPGGFRQEFHGLRLTPAQNALCVIPLVASEWLPGAAPAVGIALIPPLMAGLGLVHWVVARKQLGTGALVVLYLTLFLMAPVVTPLLLMAGLADSFFDFRQKVDGRNGP